MIIITERNEGNRVAITVQMLKFYPTSKYPMLGMGGDVGAEKKNQSLYMADFQPRNLLPFAT